MKNLLVELFVEELPPKSLKNLGNAYAGAVFESLSKQGLVGEGASFTAYASPRRLAVHVSNVMDAAPDKPVSQKLMPVKIGLDEAGNATPALIKKLASLGADESVLSQLRIAQDGKAESLYYDSTVKGATLANGLQEALEQAIGQLPIAKVMTYQLKDGWESVKFVRPVHGIVALHGADVVTVSILGMDSGRKTRGHRFEAKSDSLEIPDADSYEALMENEGAVTPSFGKRKEEIARRLLDAAKCEGLKPVEDDALLEEVTALVERPNVLTGQFEEDFLAVPQECLILTMKANQKYFPLLDDNGKLTNKFLIVSNISPENPSFVITGNERVVRPRLSDAKFFFDQDRKKTLASRVEGLRRVVYHNKLGSLGERIDRVWSIAEAIGLALGGEELSSKAGQAARLAKADLATDMVGEFPELQGIMGRYYALHDGHSPEIAFAIEDHYRPRFSGDELPRNEVGVVVALADKMEALCGLFSIGQTPTGDKDPYALRRQALGVIRILIENELSLCLDELIRAATGAFDFPADVSASLENFIYDRLSGYFREQGYSAQEIDAVLCLRPQNLGDAAKRLSAVRAFSSLQEAEALAAANKRVGNILKKSEDVPNGEILLDLLNEQAEKDFLKALQDSAKKANAALAAGDYTTHLQSLAVLKEPVDRFFDQVMVNVDDANLRNNRLRLLMALHEAMNKVADISRLAS
jgi:glycyl-tRNA synthetase beta chain